MEQDANIGPNWCIITVEACKRVVFSQETYLIVPMPKQMNRIPLCLSGLLPTHNHNRKLIKLLGDLQQGFFAEHNVVAGLFAADSFLPFADMVGALEAAGIRKVVNFPTVGAYGTLIGKTLTDVGLGFEREYETLCRFRKCGFETAVVLAEVSHKAIAREEDNFALIELARSDKQVFSKLFTQKTITQRFFLTPDATLPRSGKPPNIEGLVLVAEGFS